MGSRTKYAKWEITNLADFDIKERLDEGDALVERHPEVALDKFEMILRSADSPRALYGKARALEALAEKLRSNKHLEKSIETYEAVIKMGLKRVPEKLYLMAGERCVDRMQFRGWSSKAIPLLKSMMKEMPENGELLNQLGTQFLLIGQNKAASEMFEAVLVKAPTDPHACLHLGFVLKAGSNSGPDLERGVALLRKGVAGSSPSEVDGKFYYHLGEGLRRLGREAEADEVYHEGVREGKFLGFWQRSLYNVQGLRSKPVWSPEETGAGPAIRMLQSNWRAIRDEALAALTGSASSSPSFSGFEPEAENLRDLGDWSQLELYSRGRRNEAGCARTPRTCALVESIPSARTNKRGQVKFSVMRPGTHVHAHSGPTNCRLRAHLALQVPPTAKNLSLRVADRSLRWEEGGVFVFDDSFDHEVWFDSDSGNGGDGVKAKSDGGDASSARIVLIVDLWHPDLDERTRAALSPI